MTTVTSLVAAQELVRCPGWRIVRGALVREYAFANFQESLRFVNRVADSAEKADHHPDILLRYKRVKLTLTTHSEGGLTMKDFDLARQIDNQTPFY